jgi:hypothetical protein
MYERGPYDAGWGSALNGPALCGTTGSGLPTCFKPMQPSAFPTQLTTT